MLVVCAHILSICTHMSFVCQSYVLACHPYVTLMYSYIIRMSLICTCMSSVCHFYVLVCYPYVTLMFPYVIRMSLVCTRMSVVCTCMSSVCQLYVLVCHPYVVLPWPYRITLVSNQEEVGKRIILHLHHALMDGCLVGYLFWKTTLPIFTWKLKQKENPESSAFGLWKPPYIILKISSRSYSDLEGATWVKCIHCLWYIYWFLWHMKYQGI